MAGHKIDEIQRREDVKDAELARRLNTNQSQLKRLKDGDRRLTLAWLRRIAQALGCSVADLLADDDAPNRMTHEEQRLLSQLLKRGKGDMFDMLEIVAALDRFVSRELDRREARGAITGDSATTAELANLWTELDRAGRSTALEMIRAAVSLRAKASRSAAAA